MPTTSYDDFTAGVRAIGARTDSAGTAATDLASDEDRLINHALTEGFLTSGAFEVAADSPASMDVIVGSGTAKADLYVVEGDDDGQHPYIVRLDDASITVTLDAADASNPRIDELWLVVADATWDGGSVSLPRIGYRKGDAGASPTAPGADSSWKAAVKLATITVSAGATSIASGDIADNRAAAELNPVLSGQFADVDGDTFTGAVTFEDQVTVSGDSGVNVRLTDNLHGGTAAPSAYPAGLSFMVVSSAADWPTSQGTVFTFRTASLLGWSYQWFFARGATTAHYRISSSASDAWGDWREVTSAEDPGRWEVDGSSEVGGPVALTTSAAAVASVDLSIPSGWNSWRCEAYATFGHGQDGGGGSPTMNARIRIDGTDQQLASFVNSSAGIQQGAVGGRRTGMTTTGTRTIQLRSHASATSETPELSSIYLYARAVRTS